MRVPNYVVEWGEGTRDVDQISRRGRGTQTQVPCIEDEGDLLNDKIEEL